MSQGTEQFGIDDHRPCDVRKQEYEKGENKSDARRSGIGIAQAKLAVNESE